jgi:hypothetical protein
MRSGLLNIQNNFNLSNAQAASTKVAQASVRISTPETQPYKVQYENWYQARPYGFKHIDRNGNVSIFFLPIAPQNLSITTHFATNLIPTLYGTVEEHSPIRYYDIIIEGTTGISPQFADAFNSNSIQDAFVKLKLPGRAPFKIDVPLSQQTFGLFQKTLGTIDALRQRATNLFDGTQRKNTTGLYINQTGYAAFHNLYLFLQKYKRDAAGQTPSRTERKEHPLTFFNYKDNNQYKVAIRTFNMRRSIDNPMLYYYRIEMRGYDLQSADAPSTKDGIKVRLQELGLNGIESSTVLGKIRQYTDNARLVLSGLGAGINVLGR